MENRIVNLVKVLKALADTEGVAFVSIKGYVSKKSDNTELQDVIININVPYGTAKEKDVEFLKGINVKDFQKETGTTIGLNILEEARTSLIGSLIAPSQSRSEGQTNAYEKVNGYMKIHKETGEVYIFGMKVRKTVKIEGDFGKDTRKVLTIAKDLFRSKMKSTKYRQYIVTDIFDRLESIKCAGETIEF